MGNEQGKFYHEPVFDNPAQVPAILGPAPEEELLGIAEVVAGPEKVCGYKPLTKEQEKHLFRKMNCLKYLAHNASDPDERQDLLTQAMWLRNVILKHNLRLVHTVLKSYSSNLVPVSELISEANIWLMEEIIDTYDYRMEDNTFSGFAADRLRKRAWSYLSRKRKERQMMGECCLESVEDHRRGEHDAFCVEDEFEKLRNHIYANVEDETTIDIMFRRLGLTNKQTQTFPEISQTYGKSATWAQQKFDRAMIALFGRTVNGNFIRTLLDRQKDDSSRCSWRKKKEITPS